MKLLHIIICFKKYRRYQILYLANKQNLSYRELKERIFTTTYKLKGDDLVELL